jgi:hypothetical protein
MVQPNFQLIFEVQILMIVSNLKVCHQITLKIYYLKKLARIIKKSNRILISFRKIV